MSLFDTYVAVDWSASSKPNRGKDSVWIGVSGREPVNPPTRAEATAFVRDLLRCGRATGRRVLVGFDFPYGYPAGFADLVAPGGEPAWRRVWDLLSERIEDDENNANNRFAVAAGLNRETGGVGPFWGCPPKRAEEELSSKRMSPFPYMRLSELRQVDRRTPGVQSVWKLYGIGSVGSQSLVGIPRVASLRDDDHLAENSRVWPFETGWTVPEAQIVHVEIWPALVESSPHAVRDAGQVAGVVAHWQAWDASGQLAPLFTPSAAHDAGLEEGWIFG